MVDLKGIEPSTSRMRTERSPKLSYKPEYMCQEKRFEQTQLSREERGLLSVPLPLPTERIARMSAFRKQFTDQTELYSFNSFVKLLLTIINYNGRIILCQALFPVQSKNSVQQPAVPKGEFNMKNSEKTMEKIVALCKGRGFVYSGSEIYGGLANTWDYGPLGVEFKNNVKAAWRKKFVQESQYNVGLDSAILMNPMTWVASGHVGGFSDPLMDCKSCKERFRADKLIEDYMAEHNIEIEGSVDGWSQEQMKQYIDDNNICCPSCGKHDFTDIRQFNLMFKTFQGVTEDAKNTVYLRPETAQGIFVNFKNVQRTSRKKIPFGIGQVGKSFRNEITPGNFTFRTREFEQMELEFFCEPGTDLEWFQYWRGFCRDWLISLGIKEDEMRLRDHDPAELAFYSKGTTDIEFLFPFGWGELWGIADRTDYDLGRHQETSGQDLTYFDDEKNERYLPYVIEPSLGADRVVLAFLCAAYDEENIGTEEKPDMRTVLHFHPALAPVKIGVLPLSKKLNEGAEKVFAQLSHKYNCEFDDRGNIGKRYRRQDEIGTPFCVTYDFESENDGAVTVRDRDTMEQERIKIEDLDAYFAEKFNW